MITTTNDVKKFMEDTQGQLYIYGAGRIGWRVADYLNKCGIDFSGFIDKAAGTGGEGNDQCYVTVNDMGGIRDIEYLV